MKWSYNLFETSDFISDTIPGYRIDNLPERFNEALLKKTDLSMKKQQRFYGSIKPKLNRGVVYHHLIYQPIYLLKLKQKHISQQKRFLKI